MSTLSPTNPASSSGSGALTVIGSRSSPINISAITGIAFNGNQRELQFIQGNGGPVEVASSPVISVGSTVGQELELIGASDSSTVTLNDGFGIRLNGKCVLKSGSSIYLIWDGALWDEMARDDL